MEDELTPRQIVEELDKYIIGQQAAKRAVAIALRNRIRRRHIPEELRDEVIPKNILMIGPTGVGKTEIARRLAHLARAPFLKVEATKFTEVGYVGRDVESMVRDLVEISYRMVENEAFEDVWAEAEHQAEERLLDLLAPDSAEASAQPSLFTPQPPTSDLEAQRQLAEMQERNRRRAARVREFTRTRLQAGELEDEIVEIEVEEPSLQSMQIFSSAGMEEMGFNMQDLLGNLFPSRKTRKKTTVREARRILTYQEAESLVDSAEVAREAVERAEDGGIIFVDELDKVAGREGGHGPDVSREGVQRDILPIIEGSTVMTKYGPVQTNHVLFIAAGAFHVSKPSDLIPELQGRFPLRVELHSLTEEDFRRILIEPQNSLTKQYAALMLTEGITVEFREEGLAEIARLAQLVNERTENIGARRLYTLMERLLEDLSFEAPDLAEKHVVIDVAYVQEKLKDVVEDVDLSRYML
ncbi:MAG: ATP-dependent protease ATPase subunit HslU [Armatimonadetes bacterium]|nr:ATP-dependent protease ATPase subunit HslU [Armatimonadota bacterium]